MNVPTLTIDNTARPFVSAPGLVIQTPGVAVAQHRYSITNVTTLTITRDMHHIAHPSTVTVCEADGHVIWVEIIIDPLNGNVTIQANHPLTGYVLIS